MKEEKLIMGEHHRDADMFALCVCVCVCVYMQS